ncbi:RNA-binding protein [Acrocarpospora phusangensis]|uniref:RNA-binding protein n=1 Tax=Acrocarpospora phusangensis TaxID=1070424 RepID=A0A919Q409_9ACTN|nr:CRTAC1 family protein [Acrocarpospora phusangensis]GIH21907.1 RNA-binding protein [Acrocarpospora phusangensis]
MARTAGFVRRQLPGILALAALIVAYVIVQLPTASPAERAQIASTYAFKPMNIAMPSGFKQQTIRRVNQDYQHIDAWISSVGAGISMNDLDGDGLANDLCVTDPRIDQVVVTPAPGTGSTRYQPFALTPAGLPMNDVMAPMGCVPADLNEDGRMDLLVYLWGRTPIIYLAKEGATALSMAAYQPIEAVPPRSSTPGYTGPQWNTNAVVVDDFDGDGHDDVYVGNYFPESPVLDDKIDGGVAMNHSMSHGLNGGEDYFLRWTGSGTGSVAFQLVENALPRNVSKGWVLAAGATDVDGDMLPEMYLGHDFGPDRMMHNASTPGNIKFTVTEGTRTPLIPKSKVVGLDSFKGMGVDFGDLNGDGLYDMFVSNITTTFGIQESNFAFMSTAKDKSQVRADMTSGHAPWEDLSAPLGLAWSGWGWDLKIADFDNSGSPEVAQSTGFVKGDVNRWPLLQELATANDQVLQYPAWWPNVRAGDDVAGSQTLMFYAKGPDGYWSNVAGELGMSIPVPTRGIATGDADGDGKLDMAIARQWDEPVFYQNASTTKGGFLGLRLTHESSGDVMPGSPVVGAQVTVTMPDGSKQIGRVDGGSGHSGKRSSEVHFGLGDKATGPVQVNLCWRDRTGQIREQNLQLTPGWHNIQLGAQATER